METVKLTVPSNSLHAAQILTGFLTLKEQGWDVEVTDNSRDAGNPFYDLPVVLAQYRGQRIVYDLWDGYQDPEDMGKGLAQSDFYFKRSFSPEKNAALFPEEQGKMYPLGFNYHVTCKGNPIREPVWKAALKPLMGRTPDRYFVPEVFEAKAERKTGPVKILFLTQLWDDHDPTLSREANEERTFINETRSQILRTLKERYGDAFIGGLRDEALSRDRAPELIVPAELTERKKYLALMRSCDICIGSMGLHESIGWKTGEYVAAARAIVNERFRYRVTGDFAEGKNYLPFTGAEECVEAVRQLADSPEALFAMKRANEEYYRGFLKPEVLVKNTLETVDRVLAQRR
ncbi:hypothetical protein MR626_04645 [bacterium]|nr:hypothetical protein [bacterium]